MRDKAPASKTSLSLRRIIYGVGNNDATYTVNPTVNGKVIVCKLYASWSNMLQRCYSPSYQKKHPAYIGCTVTSEWLYFSVFRLWMEKQDWKNKSLDKDILKQGNKIYSPKTCLFVTSNINKLLLDNKMNRGLHPVGVYFSKSNNKFIARLNINGKQKHLGCFSNPEEAHEVYKTAKYNLISMVALQQIEPLKTALLNYKIEGIKS